MSFLEHPFSKVILANVIMALSYVITMYLYVIPTRLSTFKRGFMRQFDEIHQEAFGKDKKAPKMGYPDTGNGWYS